MQQRQLSPELERTLQILLENYDGNAGGKVFIEMSIFPWAGRANHELSRLCDAGMIRPVRLYDNHADIMLTAEGIEYFKNKTMRIEDKDKPSVFISYNWDSEDIAKEIEKRLLTVSNVKRDKTSLGDWESLTDFMNSIRDCDMVVLIISGKYLRSVACLYEVMQLLKNRDWSDHAMFVVEDSAKSVYTPIKQLGFIQYWENEYNKLNSALKSMDPASTTFQAEELKKIELIKLHFNDLLSVIVSKSNPKTEDAIAAIESRVKNAASNMPGFVTEYVGKSDHKGIIPVRRSVDLVGFTDDEKVVLYYILLNFQCNIDESDVSYWLLEEEVHDINVSNAFTLLADFSNGEYAEHRLRFGIRQFRQFLEEKDDMMPLLEEVKTDHTKRSKDLFVNLWKEGALSDSQKLFAAYMSENKIYRLGERWMASGQIKDIKEWERRVCINNSVSEQYSKLLFWLVEKKLVYASSWTRYSNPREYTLYKSLKEYLLSEEFKADFGDNIATIKKALFPLSF